MKSLRLASLAAVALSTAGFAQTFSVSGPGGNIPDGTTGPQGTWNVTFTGVPFTSPVTVVNPVTSITAVKIQGLSHTYRGDLHFILKDPTSVAYNLIVRPGVTTATSSGDPGNYLLGNYTIVESGGGSVAQGGVDIPAGTYDQYFNTGVGQWTNGIANTPLSLITGPAGVWTLEIRDWWVADLGSLSGWTLEGTDNSASFTSFCTNNSLGVDHTTPCPCGNAGLAGNGCGHSFDANGANLTATGTAAGDNVLLTSSNEPATSFTLFMQHDAAGDVVFHDGVLCAGGTLIRLRGRAAVAGTALFPNPAWDSSITLSQRGSVLVGSGARRYYAAWYRNASTTFCPPATANVTNGWTIDW